MANPQKKSKKGTPNRSFRAHQPSPSHLADQDSKGIMIQAPSVLFWAVDAGNKVAMLCDEKKKKTHRSLEKLDEIGDIDRYTSLNTIKSHQIPDPVRSLLGCAPEVSAAFPRLGSGSRRCQ